MALRMRPSAARTAVRPAANAGLTLYIGADSLDSDWALLVQTEKDIDGAAVIRIGSGGLPNEDFLILNPAQTLPTVSDREGVIAGARVIVEYLDERYPHPPLMPLSPSGRARVRMALGRIEHELFPLASQLQAGGRATDPVRKTLLAGLDSGMRFFPSRGWFFGVDYTLVDTAWAVLLRTLHQRGIDISKMPPPLKNYAERLFARPAFQRAFVTGRPTAAKARR